VDVAGDVGDRERLKHILERWGSAALLALDHGGPYFVAVELEAIRSIYLRDGEQGSFFKWVGFAHADRVRLSRQA
jgi:hypothetical protein